MLMPSEAYPRLDRDRFDARFPEQELLAVVRAHPGAPKKSQLDDEGDLTAKRRMISTKQRLKEGEE